ncbi:electron transfer flavoprotein subunit alpha/FixB family protein [Dendrosporobacter sp. 1207_IL3150]|uniref:electron transfer flavoprotein subunit alpha/FixB family protein n=1 Tax=Dendrosporobacter sp. 1207_IL3150 TaxID=3084054 RepID=UPI002FD9595B
MAFTSRETRENNISQEIWVYCEVIETELLEVSLELLGQGRKLAETANRKLAAVLIGEKVESLAKIIFAAGAEKVYLIAGEKFAHYNTDVYTTAISNLLEAYKPDTFIIGATKNGRDLAPRVAARLGTGLTADCTELSIDKETGLVSWTRPALGGNIMATIHCHERRPQMGTVRPSAFKRLTNVYRDNGEIIYVPNNILTTLESRTTLLEIIKTDRHSVKLEEADIIVAAGRGIGKRENLKLIEQLAEVLVAAMGASRALVDYGWQPAFNQIGQSGKTVSPKVYFACGISGTVHHLSGVAPGGIIIAINNDPDAPIFQAADYGIVGYVEEILPILIDEIKRIKLGE